MTLRPFTPFQFAPGAKNLLRPDISDYNSYAWVDPYNDLTNSGAVITVDSMARVRAFGYLDFGPGGITGAFIHEWQFQYTLIPGNYGMLAMWGVGQYVNDPITDATRTMIYVQYMATLNQLKIICGYPTGSGYMALTSGVDYYLRLTHDPTLGTYGKLTLAVYSNAARTTLVGSISLLLGFPIGHRYFYGCSGLAFGQPDSISAVISNLIAK